MSREHRLPETTRTFELQQVDEIVELLQRPGRPTITAAMLGLSGEDRRPGDPAPDPEANVGATLPRKAQLVSVTASGPPAWPYIVAHFRIPPLGWWSEIEPDLAAVLHTESLGRLSACLGREHAWGVTGAEPGRSTLIHPVVRRMDS